MSWLRGFFFFFMLSCLQMYLRLKCFVKGLVMHMRPFQLFQNGIHEHSLLCPAVFKPGAHTVSK